MNTLICTKLIQLYYTVHKGHMVYHKTHIKRRHEKKKLQTLTVYSATLVSTANFSEISSFTGYFCSVSRFRGCCGTAQRHKNTVHQAYKMTRSCLPKCKNKCQKHALQCKRAHGCSDGKGGNWRRWNMSARGAIGAGVVGENLKLPRLYDMHA